MPGDVGSGDDGADRLGRHARRRAGRVRRAAPSVIWEYQGRTVRKSSSTRPPATARSLDTRSAPWPISERTVVWSSRRGRPHRSIIVACLVACGWCLSHGLLGCRRLRPFYFVPRGLVLMIDVWPSAGAATAAT